MPTKTNLVCTASSDFSITVQTASFVDKTVMIKEFMEGYEMVMITAPRRFGKSTNLDMIKRFCELTVDEKGNRVPTNLTTNYELFTRNNLNIYKYNRVFFDNHFGKFPVIHLDFKMLSCTSYKSFIVTFKHLINTVYSGHEYLLHRGVSYRLTLIT